MSPLAATMLDVEEIQQKRWTMLFSLLTTKTLYGFGIALRTQCL
jgi:hypothetical protein